MQAQQVLHKVVEAACPQMHKKRREALSAMVTAALRGQRLTVTDLGRAIRGEAKEKHCIKRADRLASNRHLHGERVAIYASVARSLIGTQTRAVILVDWSDMDESKRHFVLRASISVQGRSLTLYEEVHTIETKDMPKTQWAFLKTLHSMLAPTCRPIIVTDAGFRTPWFRQVESLGWDWVGRVRNRHWVEMAGDGWWVACKSLYSKASATPKTLGEAKLTWRHAFPCRLVVYQDKPKGRVHLTRAGKRARSAQSRKHAAAQREPWLLATSLPIDSKLAKRTVNIYRQRMQIEEAFRDLKSTRFGLSLELHLTYQVERLQVLLLIALLALLVAWLFGKATQLRGQHRDYQANTVKDRAVLSTIFIGLRAIDDPRVKLRPPDLLQARHRLNDVIAQQCLEAA